MDTCKSERHNLQDNPVFMSRWFQKFRQSLGHDDDLKTIANLLSTINTLNCPKVSTIIDYRTGNNLLHYACAEKDNFPITGAVIRHLLHHTGCSAHDAINAPNARGDPPLTCAVRSNNLEAVKLLLDAGAECGNGCYKDERGPLHVAAFHRKAYMVRLLLARGCVDVNAVDKYGETALHHASKSYGDNTEILHLLIEAGSDVNRASNSGHTALHYATHNTKMTRILLSSGAEVNARTRLDDDKLETPLHCAIAYSNAEVVKLLMDAGADVSNTDHARSLLHTACIFMPNSTKILEYLLTNGTPIVIIDEDTNLEPLGYCVKIGCDKLAQLSDFREIVPRAGEINGKKDSLWSDPKAIANVLKFMETLINHGAKINPIQSVSPLHVALRCRGHWRIVDFLLKRGAIIDFRDELVRELLGSSSPEPELSNYLASHAAKYRPKNFDPNSLNDTLSNFYNRCVKELDRMGMTRVPRTRIFIRDVLLDKGIGRYARNKNLIEVLDKDVVTKLFPIYERDLRERIDAIERSKALMPRALVGLGRLLRWDPNSFCVPLNHIGDYLDERDLAVVALI